MLDDDGALVHTLFTSQVEDVTQPALDRLDAVGRYAARLCRCGLTRLWDAGAHLSAHLPRRVRAAGGLDSRMRGKRRAHATFSPRRYLTC
jgi:hypothetical protein